jgi:hypothetical protein
MPGVSGSSPEPGSEPLPHAARIRLAPSHSADTQSRIGGRWIVKVLGLLELGLPNHR